MQCILLHSCNRWGRPSWLQLDTSGGLESEIIFIFPSLGFPICSALVIYYPVLRGGLRPQDLVSSKMNKSCLCSLFSVGSSTDGEQPRDLLDACEAFELSSALGSETVYWEIDNTHTHNGLEWLNE